MEKLQKNVREFGSAFRHTPDSLVPIVKRNDLKDYPEDHFQIQWVLHLLANAKAAMKQLSEERQYREFLHIRCILEETEEMIRAMMNGEILESIDGGCDLIYVVMGFFCSVGIDMEPFWDEIHANNMLKIQTGTIDKGGKLIKPKNHPKPDLNKVMQRFLRDLKENYRRSSE